MSWRKTLSLVGLLASVGALALGGCTSRDRGEARVIPPEKFPFTPEHEIELCWTRRLYDLRGTWMFASFAEPLRFHDLGETIETTGYVTVTFVDGRVFGGQYDMRATYVKGDSGGPMGFVNTYSIVFDGVHLVKRMVKPQAPVGVRALVPGEFVVRKVTEDELPRVNDGYVVEMPANKQGFVMLEPYPSDYPFVVDISKDGVSLPKTINEKARYYAQGYRFDTGAGGLFHLTIRGVIPTGQVPDRYQFFAGWGNALDGSSSLEDEWVEFKDPASTGSKSVKHNTQPKGE